MSENIQPTQDNKDAQYVAQKEGEKQQSTDLQDNNENKNNEETTSFDASKIISEVLKEIENEEKQQKELSEKEINEKLKSVIKENIKMVEKEKQELKQAIEQQQKIIEELNKKLESISTGSKAPTNVVDEIENNQIDPNNDEQVIELLRKKFNIPQM